MMTELAEAIESLNGRGDIKCIMLDSSQKTFSAGISVEDSRPERVFQTLDAFTRVFTAISEISKPLIVAVNGPAIGAGSELVAFGDVIIATPNARFAQPEVKMGVFPPFAAVMLPQLIGPKKTYELILTGQAISAEEGYNLGFINRVVAEKDLDKTLEEVLARISEFSAPVLGNDQEGDQHHHGIAAGTSDEKVAKHLPESVDGPRRRAGRPPRGAGEEKAGLEEQIVGSC